MLLIYFNPQVLTEVVPMNKVLSYLILYKYSLKTQSDNGQKLLLFCFYKKMVKNVTASFSWNVVMVTMVSLRSTVRQSQTNNIF